MQGSSLELDFLLFCMSIHTASILSRALFMDGLGGTLLSGSEHGTHSRPSFRTPQFLLHFTQPALQLLNGVNSQPVSMDQ